MAYQQKPNSGSLFRVPEDKKTSDKFPEYSGDIVVTCPHCGADSGGWISAWVKESKAGKFFSLAFKFKSRT